MHIGVPLVIFELEDTLIRLISVVVKEIFDVMNKLKQGLQEGFAEQLLALQR